MNSTRPRKNSMRTQPRLQTSHDWLQPRSESKHTVTTEDTHIHWSKSVCVCVCVRERERVVCVPSMTSGALYWRVDTRDSWWSWSNVAVPKSTTFTSKLLSFFCLHFCHISHTHTHTQHTHTQTDKHPLINMKSWHDKFYHLTLVVVTRLLPSPRCTPGRSRSSQTGCSLASGLCVSACYDVGLYNTHTHTHTHTHTRL